MAAKADLPEIELAVMTVKEIADHLRVHKTTIYRMLSKGEIPAFKVGSEWRFQRESIDRWSRGEDYRNR
jgi:excisionase family DNA binding protein